MSLTAEEIKTLKSKVKAEMQRRSGYGSLTEYAGTAYDFIVQPTPGGLIKAEHGQKTKDLMRKVKSFGDANMDKDVAEGDPIPDGFNSSLITLIDQWAAEKPLTTYSSSCEGYCTGLCTSTCTGTCSGCSGTCSGYCQNSCNGDCWGCSGGCYTGCTGCSGCGGDCSAFCANSCVSVCSTCYGDCV